MPEYIARTLTPTRKRILHWIARGKTNFEIADLVGCSHLTVKNHVQSLGRIYGCAGPNIRVISAVMAVLRGDVDVEELRKDLFKHFQSNSSLKGPK